MSTSFILVRIRGPIDIIGDINDTMRILKITKKFNATIIPDNVYTQGMLKKIKDYVTWGPASPNMVKELILSRGKLVGDKSIEEKDLIKITGYDSATKIYGDISQGVLKIKDIKNMKPIFRLHPPRKGFKKSTKKAITEKGELGFRNDIDKLILRMI